MSNSERHQERRRSRAKQKVKEMNKGGRGISRIRKPHSELPATGKKKFGSWWKRLFGGE